MQTFLFITVRVISFPHQNTEEIEQLFSSFFDFEKEKIKLQIDSFTDSWEQKRSIFSFTLKKQRHIKEFTEKLFSKLNKEQITRILTELENHIDAKCHFFMRLDLDSMLKNTFLLTEGGNCLHLNMCIAAYPKKKEQALRIVETFLNNYL